MARVNPGPVPVHSALPKCAVANQRLCMITGTSITAGMHLQHLSAPAQQGIDHVQTADLHSLLTSEQNGTVVAQQRAVNDLVQGRNQAATVGSRLSSRTLHRESAGRVQERCQTPYQCTAQLGNHSGLLRWTKGNGLCATKKDVDDLDMHNNGHVTSRPKRSSTRIDLRSRVCPFT